MPKLINFLWNYIEISVTKYEESLCVNDRKEGINTSVLYVQLPPVSRTPAAKIAAGVNDTGGKFATVINDTGGKFCHHFR